MIWNIINPSGVKAFLYANNSFPNTQFNSENLLQNGWFQGSDCKPSSAGWQTTAPPLNWGFGDKFQDPTDNKCSSETGFAARFADSTNSNKDALLWQVVGPVSSASKTLHFHSLIVAHRVNQYKAEVFGANSANGPWTSVWIPFNIVNCLSTDCVNNAPNGVCNSGDRVCLWDEVTKYFLGSLTPLTKTLSQGYAYYKVQFTMNYPPISSTGAGDNGGKLARVFFKVSGGSGATSTVSPSGTFSPGDANGDGKVDGLDYVVWLNNYSKSVTAGAGSGDFNNSGIVDGLDYVIWLNNYNG